MTNKYLLDTQIALWLMLGSNKLSEKDFRNRFVNGTNQFFFHQVSTWEIQIKYQIGKLPLPDTPEKFIIDSVKESGLGYCNISDEGIFFLGKLPEVHRDPFDRLLISHAAANGWTIITADKTFESYPVKTELIE